MQINLDVNDVTDVLNILAEQPYKKVNVLIGKIHTQATEWLQKDAVSSKAPNGTAGNT